MNSNYFKLKSTIKYPTSLIINGASNVGLEVAESLLEQGGYVIIIDAYTEHNVQRLFQKVGESGMVSFLDYSAIPHLEEDVRRLDYVFYLDHESRSLESQISTQDFLKYSNYLDSTLALTVKFDAKFILSTSIKAHQLLLDSMDMLSAVDSFMPKAHSVYSDMEIQRYAESLTLEYVEKANLNARILRLGEIIGESMDFGRENVFTKLVMSAVSGEKLVLPGDGLDGEWYVHSLDAAYAVVKAQFAKETVGKVYSVAYEHPITPLSIAYKLQELEPNANEIAFDKGGDRAPMLNLHKPAPNLTHIGWQPSVDFEQAVKESLAVARVSLLNNQGAQGEDNTVISKLRSFLNIAQAPEDVLDESGSGPVSRLVAERRRQEEARQAALDKADSHIKEKKYVREVSFQERLSNFLWVRFNQLQNKFSFLKNITPGQFVFGILLLVFVAFLYFGLISPIVVIGRNMLLVNDNLKTLSTALDKNDIQGISTSTTNLHQAFAENTKLLNNFQGIARLLALDTYLQKLTTVSDSYSELTLAMSYIAETANPIGDYMESYTNNVRFRPNFNLFNSFLPCST